MGARSYVRGPSVAVPTLSVNVICVSVMGGRALDERYPHLRKAKGSRQVLRAGGLVLVE